MARPIDVFLGEHADDAAANAYAAARGWQLAHGLLYFATGSAVMKMWDGTGWIEVGTGGGSSGLVTKSGTVLVGGFAGSPPKATVTFSTAFASAAYSVTFGVETADNITYSITSENKTVNGFDIVISADNISHLVRVAWQAIAEGES